MAGRSLHAGRRRTQTTLYARMEGTAVALAEAEGVVVVGKRESGLFVPKPRGDLVESPRPAEMLDCIVVKGDLSAQDRKLHEYLLSVAYERYYMASQEGRQTAVIRDDIDVPIRDLVAFLGEAGRKAHVLKSLRALNRTSVSYCMPKGRQYFDVPMLVGWCEADVDGKDETVRFTLPKPIWLLLASQPRYGYIELAAIAAMTSKYGVALYQHLALRMSLESWDPVAPDHLIHLEPEEAASAIGYVESPLNVSRLATALKRAVDDLSGIRRASAKADAVDEEDAETEADIKGVRAFRTEYLDPLRKSAKGAPVKAFRLRVTMRPKDMQNTKVGVIPRGFESLVGAPDVREYRVDSHVWSRAALYAKDAGKRLILAHHISAAWFVALEEAIRGEVPSTDVLRRKYRGASLRAAIRRDGASRAAWGWFVEELETPDLLADHQPGRELMAALDAERRAEVARRLRLRDYKHGDRKQRASRLPKALSREEKQALHDERRAAASAERLSHLETANVVEFDVSWDCISRNGESGAIDGCVEALENVPWKGSRSVEIRLAWRSGDDIATRAVGAFRVEHDILETVLAGFSIRFSDYRPLYDPDLEGITAARSSFNRGKRIDNVAVTAPALPLGPPVMLTVVNDGLDDDEDLSTYDGGLDNDVDEVVDFDGLSVVEETDDTEIPF